MTLTEEEAKKKFCPQPDMARCHASGCMAWRWKDKPGGYENYDDARGRAEYAARQRGYCGLAGTP